MHVPTFREFGVASAVGGLAGAALQSQLTSPVLTIVLSALLVLAGTTELLRRRVPLPQTSGWRLAGGVLSGLFGGLVGNQGGIRSAALLGFQLRPRQLVATATASALLVDAARVPIYFLSAGPVIARLDPSAVADRRRRDRGHLRRRPHPGPDSGIRVSPPRRRAPGRAGHRPVRPVAAKPVRSGLWSCPCIVLLTFALAGLLATAVAFTVTAAASPVAATRATGTVFLPNPVADLQDQSLTDQKDADYAALAPAYHRVTLTNLDGSGYLRGDWAMIVSETGNPAFSPAGTFDYNRHQDEFEQVMAYYWITEAQNYIQRLGFGTGLFPAVNKEPQRVRINQWGADNSFFTDKKDELRFGKGGVDDAEDAEVILHEYGHAIQDSQQTPFGFGFSVEARSIGEGFSDYWAVTVSSLIAPTPDPACVADWDSVSYTRDGAALPAARRHRTCTTRRISTARVHHDGMIWSRALWDIRAAIGATQADTVILNAHFGMPDPTMPELAAKTVAVAKQIYGNGVANKVKAAFVARGIL